MQIDTHTHLYLPEFNTPDGSDSPSKAVERALDAGVGHMILPNVDLSTVGPMQRLHDLFPDCTSMAMGLHPTEVRHDWHESLDIILGQLDDSSRRYVAVGEIGIDLYWDKTFEAQQMQAFDTQVAWACERRLPVIIHCREGLPQVLEVLRGHHDVTGVMHSFGGTNADVEAVRRVADLYFGINGIVTFKNCNLRNVLPEIGIERILTETDSPYLAPVPMRGKRNESAYIQHTARFISQSLGISPLEFNRATSANAASLFNLTLDSSAI